MLRRKSKPPAPEWGEPSPTRRDDPEGTVERAGPPAPPAQPPLAPLDHGGRVYGVAGWSPAGSARRQVRAARQVEAEHRKTVMLERKTEMEALRRERKTRPFLPAGGETGPMAARSYRRLRVPAHRATSEVLEAARIGKRGSELG